MRRGPFEIYSIGAGGGSSPKLLFPSDRDVDAGLWTPDGRAYLFDRTYGETKGDIMAFTPEDGKIRPLIRTAFYERSPSVSPDGRWLAYEVYVSDQAEVYVSPIDGSERVQVTIDGGYLPRWARDGRSLYVLDPTRDAILKIDVDTQPELHAGRPVRFIGAGQLGGYVESYDTHPDGRLAIIVNRDTRGERVYNLILNFDTELERLVQ
jgi:Tol biopolymer transport system component